ncbi:MAG: AAA family ATPase [Gammaproteobacteria bacterium]
MDAFALQSVTEVSQSSVEDKYSALAPRPRNVKETGLTQNFLQELLLKHLYDGGVMAVQKLSARIELAGPVIDEVLILLRTEALIETRGTATGSGALRYTLTDKGRLLATEALNRNGYTGTAPVPLEKYVEIVNAQTVNNNLITRDQMYSAFDDVVMKKSLLDEVGAAMNSGRAIFVYGPAGSGKTFICQRLARVIGDPILIPSAVSIDDIVVTLFDPVIHQQVSKSEASSSIRLERGFDPRFKLCHRPAVITGGELTLDMLEVSYDPATGLHQAPLQMKAMNGIYMIDDLGRQRVDTVDLFNRWIVPMESKQDYLSLASGKRFPVPFDVTLIFSTNLNPKDLADDAFLRRIGHKIQFTYLQNDEYETIWKMVCAEKRIEFDPGILHYTQSLHQTKKVSMLPCHPRDLLGMALDQAKYTQGDNHISEQMISKAWTNYFVNLDLDPELA